MAFEFDNNYAEQIGEGVALIDCWAEWCMPCRMLAPTIDELAEEFEGRAIVGKLNADDHNEAIATLSVSALPTIIIFKDGKEVNRLTGLQSKDNLKKALEEQIGD
tara:strand:+ start:406 stop:720 length:315 start_codon:yes stop_codon:yes gene_type:complete